MRVAETLRRIVNNRLPLPRERSAVRRELRESLHLLWRNAVLALALRDRGVHLLKLLQRAADDEDGHILEVLSRNLGDAIQLSGLILIHLNAMVGHLLSRVTRACVKEARHVELERLVRRCEVLELRFAADRASEAEDALVLVEDVRRADAGVTSL